MGRASKPLALFIFALGCTILLGSGSARADYLDSPLIDNSNFINTNTMSQSAIQTFLSSKGGALASQSFPDSDNGQNETAAWIIYYASQHIGLNPQAIMATLQKEQSLITDPNPSQSQYNYAMGYGCPDTGSCSYPGFYTQVMDGTWQLRFNYERANGNSSYWNSPDGAQWGAPSISYPCASGNPTSNSSNGNYFYDNGLLPGNSVGFYAGTTSSWYKTITIANAATASLYCYTPHVYSSQYTGSYNFVYYYEAWFGEATGPGYAFVTATNPPSTMWPDTTANVSITITNDSGQTWYPDSNLPAGQHPTRLATVGYVNTPYANTSDPAWLGTQNQVQMAGTSSIAAGQNATFNFTFHAPYGQVNSYVTHFQPVVDGVYAMRDIGMQWTVSTPAPNYTYSFVGATNPPSTLLPNDVANASITVQNTGNVTWYADGNVPAGRHPVRLAESGYYNSPNGYPWDPNWLGTHNQVKMATASVAPGQNATFNFKVAGPYAGLNVANDFTLVVDGVTFMPYIGMAFNIGTPTPNYSYQFVSATNPPSVMSAGQTAQASVTLRNTGNTVWRNETNKIYGAQTARLVMLQPPYRNSSFADLSDPAWLGQSQVAMQTAVVYPGQTGTFVFNWKAPSAGTYHDPFGLVIDGQALAPDIGMEFDTTVH